MASKLTKKKARKILKDKKVRGNRLTSSQAGFFGLIASGGKPKRKTLAERMTE